MMPGRALHRLARFLLARRACEQVVEAQLADFQHEWANAANAPERAMVLVRGYAAFLVVFVSCAAGMRDLGSEERRALRRVCAISAAGTFVMTVGLGMAFMGKFHPPVHADPARVLEFQRFRLVMFFNSASLLLPLAAAVGLVCGIAIGLSREASPTSRRVLLLAAIASSVAIFVMSSWILPPAFRAFSEVVRGQPSAGQPAASTLADTRRAMEVIENTRTAGPGTIRGAKLGYHFRWSWPFASLALGFFALSLNRWGRVVRSVVGIASCCIYLYLMRHVVNDLVWTSRLPPVLLAWLPNLVFVALSLIIMAISAVGRQGRTIAPVR